LRVGDVKVPKAELNQNAAAKPGSVRVEQTIAWTGATPTAIPPKDQGQPPHGAAHPGDDGAAA
jgi:hypothetical protein